MAHSRCYCPNCGSTNLQTISHINVQTSGKNFSATQGCCGALMLGPFGMLCGLCGQGKTTTVTSTSGFACNDCGHEFPKKETLVAAAAVAERKCKIAVPFSLAFCTILCLILVSLSPENAGYYILISLLCLAIALPLSAYLSKKELEAAENALIEYNRTQAMMQERDKKKNEPTPPLTLTPVESIPTAAQKAAPSVTYALDKNLTAIDPADSVKKSKTIPVYVQKDGGLIVCPTCGRRQKDDRFRCFDCGQLFANGQPNIPYWCAECGTKGPFSECPDCGSTNVIRNVQ